MSSRESVDEYKLTCIEFIRDISNDYKDWVYRYRLEKEEEEWRLRMIDNVVKVTGSWIARYGDTIKKIDIIKDDGISKMAEFTAGYPFELNVYVNEYTRYVEYKCNNNSNSNNNNNKTLVLNVKASTREDRRVKITYYDKRYAQQFNILASAPVEVIGYDDYYASSIDANVTLDVSRLGVSDLLSITIIVGEYAEGFELDRRGFTTLVVII